VTCTTSEKFCLGGIEQSCTPACSGGNYETVACTGATFRVCSRCPGGSYCPGGASIVTCAAGTYCPSGSTGQTVCDFGYSCPQGSSSQTKCCVASTSTATSCNNTLNPGYIWLNPRVDCTNRRCNAGYYCPNSTTETACTAGNYCDYGSSKQTQCPAGYYCSTPTSMTICSANYYCPAGSTSQTPCPSSTVSGMGSSSCTFVCPSCPAGTYISSGCTATKLTPTCTACPAGSYCTGDTNCYVDCNNSANKQSAVNKFNALYANYCQAITTASITSARKNTDDSSYCIYTYQRTCTSGLTSGTFTSSFRFTNPNSCTLAKSCDGIFL
jgi:hypothetical protein